MVVNNLTGHRFGRLIVLGYSHKDNNNKHCWICQCDCGEKKTVQGCHLVSEQIKSCGCLQREFVARLNWKHGMNDTPEHASWMQMIRRCRDPKHIDYKDYGGRGITVCPEWIEFANFYRDMGKRPVGMSIERLNVNGDYCKANCVWATDEQQQNNRRNNTFIEFDGKKMTRTQWERSLGLTKGVLLARINKYGWSVEKALTTPARCYKSG